MITGIKIENFKSLRDVELRLGHMNLFIGTNASGKSNFLDALRVLQGVGYGFTIEEILNGKPKSANSEVWEPIRGGSSKVAYSPHGQAPANGNGQEVTFSTFLSKEGSPNIAYTIGFAPRLGSVRKENLNADFTTIYDSTPIDNPSASPVFEVRYYRGAQGRAPQPKFEKSRPVLHQLLQRDECLKHHKELIRICIGALSNTQRIDPIPAILRDYSHAQVVNRMGERGENFAALVNAIVADPTAKDAYMSWLHQLTPTEVDDVTIMRGAVDEPLFAIRESGVEYPAPILSDGTLRFAAIAAAFFQPDMPDLITIEEIENGIHPSRLRLLVELLRNQAGKKRQVIATTHSPMVLAWLTEAEYDTTFICTRDFDTGESRIAPLSQVPRFLDTVKKRPIADLFAEGWLEAAL